MKIEKIRNKELVHELLEVMRPLSEVNPEELALTLGKEFTRDFRIAFAQANSILHSEGLGFRSLNRGAYRRATTAEKVARSARMRAASARKLARQYVSLVSADESQLPEAERDTFRRSVEKNGVLTARALALLSRRNAPQLELSANSIKELPRGRPR